MDFDIRAAAAGEVPPLCRVLQVAKEQLNSADERGKKPLHLACLHGHARAVELLLRAKALINSTDLDGRTPLIDACSAGEPRVVSVLLAAGAPRGAKPPAGATASDKATSIRRPEDIMARKSNATEATAPRPPSRLGFLARAAVTRVRWSGQRRPTQSWYSCR